MKLDYPPHISFDTFLDEFARTGGWTPRICRLVTRDAILTDPRRRWALVDATTPRPRSAASQHAIEEQLQRAREAKVTVLTRPALDLVLEAADRIVRRVLSQLANAASAPVAAAQAEVPLLPMFRLDPLPTTPQWIEFEDTCLGDADFPIRALWFERAARWLDGPSDDELLAVGWPVPPETVCVALVESPWESKGLWLYPDGSHSIHQSGTCTQRTCPFGQKTHEGLPYALHSAYHAQAFAAIAAERGVRCECSFTAWTWSVILYVLFAYLRFEHTSAFDDARKTSETVSYRLSVPPLKRSQRQAAQQTVEAWNRVRPPVYRRVSLTTHTASHLHTPTVKGQVPAHGGSPSERDAAPVHLVTRTLEPHARFLVPGPGLPWKQARVVLVREHTRRYHTRGGRRTRTVVLP